MTPFARVTGRGRVALAALLAVIGTLGIADAVGGDACGPDEAIRVGGSFACLHVDDRSDLAGAPDRGALLQQSSGRALGVAFAGSGSEAPLELVCDRTSNPRRVEVLYAHTAGKGRLAEVRDELEDHVRFAQLQYDFSAFVAGSQRAWIPRFVTEGSGEECRIAITSVQVSAAALTDLNAFIDELFAKGYDDPDRAYMVFVEDGPYCGVGTLDPTDDRPDPAENNNNVRFEPAFSRIDEPCWGFAEAHELGHNLGAVQQSAPHSTGGSHCTDGYDAMCYDDGTVGSGGYGETVCPDELSYFALDCNNDDYFSPAPAPGSHLASRWNIRDNEWLLETFTDAAIVGLTVGPTGTRFDDVALDDTFMRDIDDLARNGVTRGCNPPANTKYCPSNTVTREQMAAFLNRLLGLPAGSATFTDVPADSPFRNDIAALADAGITRGCNPPDNTEFCPKDPVTREQMAAFLKRALDLPAGTATFTDVPAENPFSKDIAALADAGITRGCNPPDNTKFCPGNDVTREQMAAFLKRTGLLTE